MNSLQAHVDENGALVSGVRKLASYEKDPFMAFKDSILLAEVTTDPFPHNPNEQVGKFPGTEEADGWITWPGAEVGQVADKNDFDVVYPNYPPTDTEDETDCPDGYVWNALLGKCLKVLDGGVVSSLYMKREVTCCGDGQTVEKPEEPEPEEPGEGTCKDPTYAEENACECSPSTANCCTAVQKNGGMVYNSSTKTCACPSGQKWNSQMMKCEANRTYTCWVASHAHTIATGQAATAGQGDFASPQWQNVSYARTMACAGQQVVNGYVSCKPGQQCTCEPGKEYLWYETYG